MYHQLISEQRSQIFALLQKKTARKEIADIVGISQSTLSREIKRNSTPSGKYIWTKAHDMAMQRRKSTVTNAKLSDELVWRIKEYITKNFPNEPEREALIKLIYPHLNGDNRADSIKKAVSQMGMTCEARKEICEYTGYIRTKLTGHSSGSGRAKHIYHIVISPKKGMDSLTLEYQILEDTEN